MTIYCKLLLVLFLEALVTAIFSIITPKGESKSAFDWKSVVKGLVERAFLTYSLISGFPHVLTLFGALKLGTRLKSADNEKTPEGREKESRYNDYYLVGNFISVSLSIFYYTLFHQAITK